MENAYISFVISLSFNRGFSIVSDIKLLLLTFSKRLDNLLSACVSLDFICSFRFVGLVFIEISLQAYCLLLSIYCTFQSFPESFSLICYPSLFSLFSFPSFFFYFIFAFRSKMLLMLHKRMNNKTQAIGFLLRLLKEINFRSNI